MEMIGLRVKKRRLELNLTQALIKEKTGISTGNLSDIERGRSLPSASALISLAKILNCSTDWLLTGNSLISDITEISDSQDSACEYSNLFHQLTKADQEEILDFIRLKISKYKNQSFSSSDNQNDNSKKA